MVFAVATTQETKTVLALMKRLSISAEDAERSAAVSEVVALVKEGGVAALKVNRFGTSWTAPPKSFSIAQMFLCV